MVMEEEKDFNDKNETDPELIKAAINALYLPAHDICQADELISQIDLYEEVSKICHTDLPQLYNQMKHLGFTLQNIDGQFLWLVKYPI